MASNPPPRGASVAERRASAALRQQQSRPASAATERLRASTVDSRPGSQATQTRRVTTTTETSTKRRVLEQEATLRRTKTPLQTAQPREEQRRSPRPDAEAKRKSTTQKSEPSIPPQPQVWSPTATLLSPTPNQAPLASRVSVPPQAKHAPTSLAPPSMAGLNLNEQERALIDDLLYVLLGFEGQYISFSSDRSRSDEPYDPFDEKSRLTGPNYKISSGVDPSLRDLALQILRTATHASALEAFCEVMSRGESGSVSHALCAAIRKLQKDFLVLVAQLENQYLTNDGFSLHQMSLYLKKSAHVMSQLYSLAQEVLTENGLIGDPVDVEEEEEDEEDEFENVLASLKEGAGTSTKGKKSCIGGALLALLTRRLQAMSGDPQAKELLSSLLKDASKPYVRMLNEWLHHGNVKDPHQEFMVKEAKSIKRELLEQDYTDEYWEKRYTLRQELVPPQIEGVRDRVLLAGKYLNVVRECSSVATFSTTFNTDLASTAGIPHDVFDMNLISNVNQAYTNANAALMRLLLTTHQLPQRLSSLKHYFFLDRSDWFTYFLELSQSELRKSARSANVGKLQSLLDLVLHTPGSVAAEDPFKEDVKVNMADTGLTGWLMRVVNVQGMDADTTSMTNSYNPATESVNGKDEKEISAHEALTLDFGVPFPLSLIISRVTLTRYQLLFRYLLSLKHLESQLVNSWCDAGGIGTGKRDMSASRGSKSLREVGVWRRKTGNPKIELWKKRAWCLR
jgi:gamma-tubulin complex component 2